ncbi:hypothetical protein AAE02nite_02570 [Adhaeribacter aerolatus]|uniref:Uncharacterized protein n=1 Tax=Adhaeribacter aerolatus TaxID=670289 RepID=A0A512ASA9_9BACT|nr:hypothetical protein AAE02nite_02570 [Adhaeribacter aerolatus]
MISGHNFIQAVNRVAIVFRDKPSGLIVGYVGIDDKLRIPTKKYTAGGGKGSITIDTEEAFERTKEVIQDLQSLFTHIFARLLNSPPLEGAGGGQNPILLPKP